MCGAAAAVLGAASLRRQTAQKAMALKAFLPFAQSISIVSLLNARTSPSFPFSLRPFAKGNDFTDFTTRHIVSQFFPRGRKQIMDVSIMREAKTMDCGTCLWECSGYVGGKSAVKPVLGVGSSTFGRTPQLTFARCIDLGSTFGNWRVVPLPPNEGMPCDLGCTL